MDKFLMDYGHIATEGEHKGNYEVSSGQQAVSPHLPPPTLFLKRVIARTDLPRLLISMLCRCSRRSFRSERLSDRSPPDSSETDSDEREPCESLSLDSSILPLVCSTRMLIL